MSHDFYTWPILLCFGLSNPICNTASCKNQKVFSNKYSHLFAKSFQTPHGKPYAFWDQSDAECKY